MFSFTPNAATHLCSCLYQPSGCLIMMSGSEKLMPLDKQKKKNNQSNNISSSTSTSTSTSSVKKHRFLVIVNVLGSAGPVKCVVNGDDCVAAVIDTALKLYAREGRLPLLGSDVNNCLLYPVNAGSDALNPYEMIAACGGRNFLLCKKQTSTHPPHMTEMRSEMMAKNKSSCWMAWLNISSSISKISSQ